MVVLGSIATVGCTRISEDAPAVAGTEAPAYRTSVAVSSSAAAAASRTREAKRQQQLTTQAIRAVCDELSITSADAVLNLNTYVDAVTTGGDRTATVGPAREALNRSADQVSAKLNDRIPKELRTALDAWVAAARGAATVLAGEPTPQEFNSAVDTVNTVRSPALDRCDAAY